MATQGSEALGKRFLIIDEDRLREKVLELAVELSPELRRDTERMADLLREVVTLEREKLGLDNPKGTLDLTVNQKKTDHGSPDVTGTGWVAGRFYRACGWITGDGKLRIALLPLKEHR